MRIVHESTETTATIRIEGLRAPVRVLHLTDTHLNLCDERDAAHRELSRGREEKFSLHRKDEQQRPISTSATWVELMRMAAAEKPDLLALTGDIVTFPSHANLDLAAKELAQAGLPWLYTTGNHDWQFSAFKPSNELRREYYPRLAPLHGGAPFMAMRDVGGVRFVAIDDSTYQIDEEQLAFTRTALAAGLPTVLLIHIPISLATLRPQTIATWKAPILIGDPDWNNESRDGWHAGRDGAATLEFVRALAAAPNLAAVLCGHIHFPHADNVSPRAVQYVGKPGYLAGFRRVELLPL
ncbi:MAG: metallophosphoesterase [Planctomycetota bacterium]|nr:metallophosphoesterase [Planctomycetota bacterium]